MNSAEGERGALAQSLRTRDPEVFEQLIDRYQYRLFRYLTYLTGNREVAEDLFQETWIRVLSGATGMTGDRSLILGFSQSPAIYSLIDCEVGRPW